MNSKHQGLSNISGNTEDIANYYDNWSSDYNKTLAEWRYDAPEQIAAMLMAELSPEAKVLDAGCGTGLSGKALRTAGFETVNGIDVSSSSLEVASASGAYNTVQQVNMQQRPFPISNNQYDGLVCVGVLTYMPDSMAILKEFCRVVRPGGAIAVTQRSDLFEQRDFGNALESLAGEGVIENLRISEPRPYLPNHEEFGDKILVHYVTFGVL